MAGSTEASNGLAFKSATCGISTSLEVTPSNAGITYNSGSRTIDWSSLVAADSNDYTLVLKATFSSHSPNELEYTAITLKIE